MSSKALDIRRFLETVHPYDSLPREELDRVGGAFSKRAFAAGSEIYRCGEPLPGLFLVMEGKVEVRDRSGTVVSQLLPRNSLGERGLMIDDRAVTSAYALQDSILLMLPKAEFKRLMAEHAVYSRFFTRGREGSLRRNDITVRKVKDLMSVPPRFCAPSDSVLQVAQTMRTLNVSSLAVVDEDKLVGIVTTQDLAARVVAEALDPTVTAVSAIMTRKPVRLQQDALGSDVLSLMLERNIGHLPIVAGKRLVGMITQTDITRFQALSSAFLVRDISSADSVSQLQQHVSRVPQLLVQLVGGNTPHETVTRLVTDVTDAVTRRLITLAEQELGPPPVPYVWLACGSQGRQEQTGVSDQDNCIFIDDGFVEAHRPWYVKLARFVSDSLDACGYFFCPGDMMATNQRWCQPVRVWRDYFRQWIQTPDPMAQMLASVMFDLRPIAGKASLFHGIQAETLEEASRNSIFVAHMVSNSLKHAPPLGLLRGFATIRSGEHRNQIDMKHSGVVPIVDLGRVYAMMARLTPVNTRARLLGAEERGVISEAGARDLIAAYDLIAELRLRNQASQIKAGRQPDNHLAPYDLGDLERSHLRDAFVVVRTMQSALANSGSAPR